MADTTRSPQEAGKTPGSEPGRGSGMSAMAGGQPGQPGGQMGGGSATRPARDLSAEERQAREERGGESESEMMGQTRQSVSDAYQRASRSINETYGQALDYSRENPGKATLIAFGVGVGVGLLMANGLMARGRSRRIVPPVMNALSEIASELLR